jgi:hypothetical protein
MLSLRASFVAAVSLALVHLSHALDFGFPYGTEKVRGVNIGGWLVLEVSMNWQHLRDALSHSLSSHGSRLLSSITQETPVSSTNGHLDSL